MKDLFEYGKGKRNEELIVSELKRLEFPYTFVNSRTIPMIDEASEDFVCIHGWDANWSTKTLKAIGKSNGFTVTFCKG